MTTATFDTVVVGAGPAGSAAATVLANAGHAVALVDRAQIGRDKCCGDGLTTGALRRLEALGLRPEAVPSYRPVSTLAVRSPAGRVVRLPLDHGAGQFAAAARRRDLDAALVRLAITAGADPHLGDGIASLVPGGAADAIEVALDSGQLLRARSVIAADGAWSPVRKLVQPPRGRAASPEWHAFRAYATDVNPVATRELWVLFARDLLPGYAWAFPVAEGVLNVGVCVRRTPTTTGRDLADAFSRTLETPFLASLVGPCARFEGLARSWPIPTGVARRTLAALEGRVLFVGDAAGAADPLTGEGVGQALESGCAAAEAILEARGDVAAQARAYRARIDRGLARDQRLSTLASTVLSRPRAAEAVLLASASTHTVASAVGRWLFEDYPRSLTPGVAAWRTVRAHRPGAFAVARGGPGDDEGRLRPGSPRGGGRSR